MASTVTMLFLYFADMKPIYLTIISAIVLFFYFTMKNKSVSPSENKTEFDIQGHRGTRGLYPENSLKRFIEAVKLGVRTLEMDIIISKDIIFYPKLLILLV